ncbi:MAG: TMEM43 family protein [Reyranella sp.]|uniref:TMEM43 family protein n=1 Tax=Reyranella sp. TaxID=1929291 RepID=UPI003D0B8B1C
MAEEEGRRDEVSEVERTGWLSRLGRSFGGVLVGLVLIVGSGMLLFWNEGRSIETAQSLTEGAAVVLEVGASKMDPANDGRLVYVAGPISVASSISDVDFGVLSDGLRLVRKVEMYQWTEEQHTETHRKLGGAEEKVTTYRYARKWMDRAVDSSKFHERTGHANPPMTWQERNLLAPRPRIGAYALPDNMVNGFGTARPLPVAEDRAASLERRLRRPVRVVDGVLYIAGDPARPVVGDVRISYGEVPLQEASVIARQSPVGLGPYQTHAGGAVELIMPGRVPSADMFKSAEEENETLTWLIRGGGCLLMFFGFCLILGPLGVLGDVVPVIGDVVRAGAGLVGFLFTAVVAPLIIAIAWLWYRPIVAISVVIVGAVLAWGAIWVARLHKADQQLARRR